MSKTRMRLVVAFAVCAALLWPRAGSAQTPARDWSPRGAQTLLASSDPRDQAWGAWIARGLRHRDAAPLIEAVVKIALSSDRDVQRLYVALDALIELDAAANPTLLLEVSKHQPVQALIMLSRLGASANAPLLEILSRSRNYEWFAAANLLNQRQAPGFAALVLKDVNFVARVVVSMDGNTGMGSEGGMSFAIGDKAGGLADGYPPIADYEFRSCSSPGLVLLAPGPVNVCYQRYVSRAGLWSPLSSHHRSEPTVDDRLDFFRRMAPNVDLNSTESVSIAWKDDNATKDAMRQLVDGIRRRHRYLLDQLVSRQLLTDTEAAALSNPVIREEIVDLRKPQK